MIDQFGTVKLLSYAQQTAEVLWFLYRQYAFLNDILLVCSFFFLFFLKLSILEINQYL